MSSLRDIRRRIHSVEKTQQITRAMRMVAAAKLRRAQQAIEAARPYAEQMRATLEEVARGQVDAEHPLLTPRAKVARVEIVAITSDRGLCGAFNANVMRHVDGLAAERERQGARVVFTAVGRKAADHLRRRRRELRERITGRGTVAYPHATDIARPLAERYADDEVDEVLLVYAEFVSTMTQRPRHVRLLPFTAAAEPGAAAVPDDDAEAAPFEVEPSAEELLRVLVPKAVEVEVYRALLESQAGEHAARMTAMESATRNTEEMIETLTLNYNRARQAAITKELVEIVSGAEAL